MAIEPLFDGPALVEIDANQGAGLESLGYTEDGVGIARENFWYNVHGDQNGGLDGPPIDIQYLGQIWRVSMLLTSWETTVADKIANGVAGIAPGSEDAIGTLLFTGTNKIFRLLINPTVRPFNFLRAVPLDAFEINKGTKHSKLQIEWVCYKNASNIFFNQITS